MPTTIRLTTMPGTIQRGRDYDAITLDLLGSSLGTEHITIRETSDVAPAVTRFGERVRAAHPEASFKINITVAKGQRKPPGFDAAMRAGVFGERAFMRVENEDDTSLPAATEEVVS